MSTLQRKHLITHRQTIYLIPHKTATLRRSDHLLEISPRYQCSLADSIHSGNLPCVIEDNPYHLALLYPLIQLISFSALIGLPYMLDINKPHGNIALRSVFYSRPHPYKYRISLYP